MTATDFRIPDRISPMRSLGLMLAATIFLSACDPFELSPYQVAADGLPSGLTRANLAELGKDTAQAGAGFSMAVLSDVHTRYDELRAAVAHIEADTSIRLTLVTGDLTQSGLYREYRWMAGILSRLSRPWFTVLGNHDALANGVELYRRIFGPLEYSFTFRGAKMVFYNDNAWEFPCCVPDFAGLEAELSDPEGAARLFAISHQPPFGDQLDSAAGCRLKRLLEDRGVALSIHGHQHNYHLGRLDGGKVMYLVADKIGARNYAKVTVRGDSQAVERVYF
jgi:3',5'-cyclic-AMP phosphodiesterase